MKAKNIMEWLVSLAGLATLGLSLGGLPTAALIAAGVSLLLSLVLFIWRLVSAIRAGQKKQILLQFLMLIAMILLIAGLAGLTYANSSGFTQKGFDARVPYMQQFADRMSAYAEKPKTILTTVMLFLARYRMIFLCAGGTLMLLYLVLAACLFFSNRKKRKAEAADQSSYTRPRESTNTAKEQPGTQAQWQQWVQPPLPTPMSQVSFESAQPVEMPQDYDPEATIPDVQPAVPESHPAIRICNDHCCICGAELSGGYATLFTDSDGREARIDEACWNRIDFACNGNDPQLITEVNTFFYGQMPLVEPAVAKELQSYVQEATRRLAENQ